MLLVESFVVIQACDERGGGRLLLLVADGLMIRGVIVLELLHVGPAAFKILFCGVGRGVELYLRCNDLTVRISQLGLS